MSWLLRYWAIQVPTKSPAQLDAEEFLFVLSLGKDKYAAFPRLKFARWHLFVACFLAQLGCGSLYSFAFISDALDVYFNTHEQAYGVLLKAYIFMGVTAALLGPSMERRGPRASMILATFLVAIGMLISQLSVAAYNLVFLTLGYSAFCGMGFGMTILATISTVQKWFPDLRGIASGLCMVAFGLGNGLFSFVYSRLLGRRTVYDHINDLDGVPLLFWRTGLVIVFFLVLCTLVIRTPPVTYSMNGQDIHCVPVNMAPDPDLIQDEYLRVGMTFVNYEKVHHELEGTDGHYFQQVKAMSLLQCIASTDFVFLYIAFATNVIPLLVFVPEIFDMGIHMWQLSVDGLTRLLIQAFIANVLGRLAAPLASDGLIRLLYANPAYMRKVVFVGLLLLQLVALALLRQNLMIPTRIQWIACALTFASGGGLAIMPCFVTDMFGVYHSGTMYGLILTSYSLGGVVVGYAKASFELNFESLDRQVHVLLVLAVVGCVSMIFVRTSSKDRFYQGYQYTLCGKTIIQIPLQQNQGPKDTMAQEDDSLTMLDCIPTPPPLPAVFTLWDADVDPTL